MCLLGRHQAGTPRPTIRACHYIYKIQSKLGKILLFYNVIYVCTYIYVYILQDLPMLLLFLSCALTLLGVLSPSYCIMSFTYVMASWVYLRFYQIRADGTRGDMSDNFSFASFFPEPIQWVPKSVCVFHTAFHSQPQIYFHTIVFSYHNVIYDPICENPT